MKPIKFTLALLAAMIITLNASAKKKVELETVVYKVNIHCDMCEKKINDTFPYEKGVKKVNIDRKTNLVTISFDSEKCSNSSLLATFEKLKLEAERDAPGIF